MVFYSYSFNQIENLNKIEVVPLTQLDILHKDFRGKKIEQEDGTRFWTQKSFSFEEILGMGFID